MTVTTITYARLVNVGQYENFRIEMTADLAPGEDAGQAAAALRDQVHAAIREELIRRDAWKGSWPDLFPEDDPARKAASLAGVPDGE